MFSPAAAPKGVTNLPSATNARCATRSSQLLDGQLRYTFPKNRRLLRRSDFRKVYDEGLRISCPYFAAFCLRRPGQDVPCVGFTVPRALGKAVKRNRMKRRIREAVRLHLHELSAGWAVVFNPRRPLLEAPFDSLRREVQRVFSRCAEAE